MDLIPYTKPFAGDEELLALAQVVRSGMWTNGPVVRRFEAALCAALGAEDALCVANGTLALHALLLGLRGSGRALYVTSSLNFAAGASAARLLGYDVAFTDVDASTLNMSAEALSARLAACRADYSVLVINPVHFAGVLADTTEILRVARAYGGLVIEDACHALVPRTPESHGAYHPECLASVFSFHATKNVAAGEGGAIASNDVQLMGRLRGFCNHNMSRSDFVNKGEAFDADGAGNPWYYEIRAPGTNFRLSEFHAALGLCQLDRLPEITRRRAALAARYRGAFADLRALRVFPASAAEASAFHLFPVSFDLGELGCSKAAVFAYFREHGIVPQVHYTPLHRQPAFRDLPHVRGVEFPELARVSPGLLSLPLYYGLSDSDQERVITCVRELCRGIR